MAAADLDNPGTGTGDGTGIGIALSGGAAYGLAHIGVLAALAEAGIRPAAIAGTSMGALVAAFWVTGRMDALESWARQQRRLWWLSLADPLPRGTGLIRGQRIVRLLSRYLGDTRIEDLPIPYAAVAVDLRTDRAVALGEGPLVEAVRASIAVPGLMDAVERDGAFLVDGGLLEPVPIASCRTLGVKHVIAVGLHGDPEGEVLAAGLIPAGANGRAGRPRPSPGAVSAAAHGVMLRRIADANLRDNPPDLLIAPRVAHCGLTGYHRADELIAEGHRAAAAALAAWDRPAGG